MNTATATANAAAEVEVVATKDPAVGLGRATVAGYPIQVGPMKWLAEERAALMARKWKHFEARQLGATIGAELHGVDITRPLDEKIVAEIREALHAYKVIFFRDQPLSAQGHVEFAQSFGELEIHPFLPGNTGRRELVRFEKSAGRSPTCLFDVALSATRAR